MQTKNIISTERDSSVHGEPTTISSLYAERLSEISAPALVARGKALVANSTWDAGGYYNAVKLTVPVDWAMDPFNDRTWRWFLHQFEFARSLLAYDFSEKRTDGYQLLKEFVNSWANLYLYDLSNTDSVWHDHGTALRARNLLLLLAYMKRIEIDDDVFLLYLVEVLEKHARVLLEDSFYSKGTNHGLDQNIVLFEILKELNGRVHIPGALETATERINFEIAKAFAPDGGHIENSAAYLTFGLKQAIDALHIGRAYDGERSLIRLPEGLLERATAALIHTIRPDNKLPLVGDTCDYTVRDIFRDITPENYEQFLYSAHGGTRGVAPQATDLILKDSGWAILRSTWDNVAAGQYENQLHCVFKCGFLSNYHRHDDDLSFVLYYKGKDWIVEGGLYKHSRTDPYRLYFRSAQAHNISMPVRSKASRILENAKDTGITLFEREEGVTTVSANSCMFAGFRSTRKLVYNREKETVHIADNILPISLEREQQIDQLMQRKAFTYVTRFLVPEGKKVSFDKSAGICTIRDGEDVLSIKCKGHTPEFRVTIGQTKPEIKGWISHRPNKLKPCHVIEFFYREHILDVEYEFSWS